MKTIACCVRLTEELVLEERIFEQPVEVPPYFEGEVLMKPGVYFFSESEQGGYSKYMRLSYCPFCGTKIEMR